MYETELYHHGVKGMRWGVRKTTTTATINKKRNALDAASDLYKSTDRKSNKRAALKAKYKLAKKDYNREIKKKNTDYTDEMRFKDAFNAGIFTPIYVNRLINRGMNLTDARLMYYRRAGELATQAAINKTKREYEKKLKAATNNQ